MARKGKKIAQKEEIKLDLQSKKIDKILAIRSKKRRHPHNQKKELKTNNSFEKLSRLQKSRSIIGKKYQTILKRIRRQNMMIS